ncbi:YifB family Mg chelatase-like AAA ATPase [Patescibacteria group bacterium]
MLIKVKSAANYGINTIGVDVEVNVASRGFPSFDIVGLPSKAVAESKDRVKTAIINSGFEFPNKKITINLAPADLPKEGSFYDLPIAVGIMSVVLEKELPESSIFYGELSLDGGLRHTKGSLLIAIYAKENDYKKFILPISCANEASVVDGIDVIPINNLRNLHDILIGVSSPKPHKFVKKRNGTKENHPFDFVDVLGQYQAKRALEIAIAGGHNCLLVGSPGGGKTMLAKALKSVLPPLNYSESIEVTKIYSAAGIIKPNQSLISARQIRSPHHTTSYAGMIGGGSNPKPGEISLAHRGVLFLDELAEFPRHVLETLRQPIEDGEVTIARSLCSVTFPCRFIFIAASNPCPCGYASHPKRTCTCTQHQINRYNKKISGPLLDRIDLHVNVNSVDPSELSVKKAFTKNVDTSKKIKNRILEARKIQLNRLEAEKLYANSEMNNEQLGKYCVLSRGSDKIIKFAIRKFNLSARSYFKIIKVSRTIADLDRSKNIEERHVSEALQFRRKHTGV